MPGLKDFWAAFKAGRHTDSKGRVRDWTNDDIDFAANSYNPEEHKAPIVIGHPEDNKPAWGWIAGARNNNGVLELKGEDIVPEFEEMVKTKRFPKRSISFYPDGRIRHVAFLGAQPPAVKGLPDINFGDDERQCVYEFAESAPGQDPATPGDNPTIPEGTMPKTAEELQAELDAKNAELATAQAQVTQYKEQAEKNAADFSESETKRKRTEREARFNALLKADKAKVLPGEKDAILLFASKLGEDEATYEFAEGAYKESTASGAKSTEDMFWDFLEKRGSHGLFTETTPEDQDKKNKDASFAEDEETANALLAAVGQEPIKKQ